MNKRNACPSSSKLTSSSLDPIIGNGTVQMGIHPEGHLNVPGGTPSSETGTTFVGLRYIPTNAESTAPGCLCEGWGVANFDAATGTFSLYANESTDSGAHNMIVDPGTGETIPGIAFKSIVSHDGGRVRVTHDYKPSISPNLYQVDVTIENLDTSIGDLRYRRVMDWDVEPTAFNEWVRIHVGDATNLLRAHTDGFDTANPLIINPPAVGVPPTTLVPGDPDYFSGPDDQGSLFDFGFGALAPGESRTFTIFYGAAANETLALTALATVRAEVFSLGYPTDTATNEARLDGPNIFIFAFQGVGGTPVGPPQITCSADITLFNDPGLNGAIVNFPDPVVDGTLPITTVCTPSSGSFFPAGNTTVTCIATDAAGNTSTCAFNVRVVVDPCRFFSGRCCR